MMRKRNAVGLDGGLDRGMTAQYDDVHGQNTCGLPLFEQGHAIRVGHPDVKQDQVKRFTLVLCSCLGGVFGQLIGVTFVVENFTQQIANAKFVIYYQYVCHVLCVS